MSNLVKEYLNRVNLGKCPKCKQGPLQSIGKVSFCGSTEHRITLHRLKCLQCGHIYNNRSY